MTPASLVGAFALSACLSGCLPAPVDCLRSDVACTPAIAFVRGALGSAMPTASASDFGTGRDGPLVVAGASTVINAYTEIADAAVSAGAGSFNVADASSFSVNDLILVVQMEKGSGTFAKEYTTITAKAGNNLTVSPALVNGYTSGGFGQPNTTPANVRASQIVRVPQYTTVTVNAGGSITPTAWNGNIGGVIAFRANGIVTVNGSINASGMGFRPGAIGNGNPSTSSQGESHRGMGIPSLAENSGAGSGATTPGTCSTASGGLAAHATAVTGTGVGNSCCGATPSTPGTPIAIGSMSEFVMGPGGGGSSWDLCSGFGWPLAGAGGGLIIVDAFQLDINSGTGSINANGQNGFDNSNPNDIGAAGAGGSIYVRAGTINIGTNLVTAIGGTTSNIPSTAGSGPIRLDFNLGSGTTNPAAAYGSTTVSSKSPLEQ